MAFINMYLGKIRTIKDNKHIYLSRFKNYIRQPHVVLSLVLLALLVVLVVIPILKMFIDTFIWQMEDIRLSNDAEPGKFTLFTGKEYLLQGFPKQFSGGLFLTLYP